MVWILNHRVVLGDIQKTCNCFFSWRRGSLYAEFLVFASKVGRLVLIEFLSENCCELF